MDAELVGEVFGGTQTPAMARGVTDPYGLAALGPLRPAQLLYYLPVCCYQKTAPCRLAFWVVNTKSLHCRTEN